MLLLLLKILLFLTVILSIAFGLNYLAANSDGMQVVLNGIEFTLGPIQAVAALIMVMIAAWVFFKLLGILWASVRFIMGDETAIQRYFSRSRREKGIEALSQGLLAVAAGEGQQAQQLAGRAAKYLDDPRATRLLAAQAAEVAGDHSKAETVYREMLEDDRTRFVGVRGLMKQKLATGDTKTALALAQKAYALRPRHLEIQDTVLNLSVREGDWKGARAVLKDERKQGRLPRDVHIRRDAVLALQEAREVLAQGASVSAQEAAISAAKASPDLVPAVVLAAQIYIEKKDRRSAERLLEKAWSIRPHPALAATYAEVVPDETPAQRLRRFERLMKHKPDDQETRLLRAELLLANEDFPAARRALGELAETDPTTRTLAIMAAIERGEGADDAVVRAWLVKAMTASRGPQWVCEKCEYILEEWVPVCDSCGSFDTVSWRELELKHTATSPTGAEFLPLLIGKPAPAQLTAEQDKNKSQTPSSDDNSGGKNETPMTPEPAVSIVADVAPGMVPREEDFINKPSPRIVDSQPSAKGSMTVPEPSPKAEMETTADQEETAITTETKQPAVTGNDKSDEIVKSIKSPEMVPVRPDVEPLENNTLLPANPSKRTARMVLDGDIPPRPDVEPIQPEKKKY